jgi:GTPase-activator protein for Ras-like GTPase
MSSCDNNIPEEEKSEPSTSYILRTEAKRKSGRRRSSKKKHKKRKKGQENDEDEEEEGRRRNDSSCGSDTASQSQGDDQSNSNSASTSCGAKKSSLSSQKRRKNEAKKVGKNVNMSGDDDEQDHVVDSGNDGNSDVGVAKQDVCDCADSNDSDDVESVEHNRSDDVVALSDGSDNDISLQASSGRRYAHRRNAVVIGAQSDNLDLSSGGAVVGSMSLPASGGATKPISLSKGTRIMLKRRKKSDPLSSSSGDSEGGGGALLLPMGSSNTTQSLVSPVAAGGGVKKPSSPSSSSSSSSSSMRRRRRSGDATSAIAVGRNVAASRPSNSAESIVAGGAGDSQDSSTSESSSLSSSAKTKATPATPKSSPSKPSSSSRFRIAPLLSSMSYSDFLTNKSASSGTVTPMAERAQECPPQSPTTPTREHHKNRRWKRRKSRADTGSPSSSGGSLLSPRRSSKHKSLAAAAAPSTAAAAAQGGSEAMGERLHLIPSDSDTLEAVRRLLFNNDCQLACLCMRASIGADDEAETFSAFVTLFMHYQRFMQLTETAFQMELDAVVSSSSSHTLPTTFLRGDSVFTKLMAEFLRRVGDTYRRHIIVPLIQRIAKAPMHGIEIDPQVLRVHWSPSMSASMSASADGSPRLGSDVLAALVDSSDGSPRSTAAAALQLASSGDSAGVGASSSGTLLDVGGSGAAAPPPSDDRHGAPNSPRAVNEVELSDMVERNVERLCSIAQEFFDGIIHSIPRLPIMLRQVLRQVSGLVRVTFPRMPHTDTYSFIGSILFLRYICPALVMPAHHGVVKSAPPRHVGRGLILVSKMLQNLSNGVEFGDKEQCMVCLNAFIIRNRFTLRSYFRHVVHVDVQKRRRSRSLRDSDVAAIVNNSDSALESSASSSTAAANTRGVASLGQHHKPRAASAVESGSPRREPSAERVDTPRPSAEAAKKGKRHGGSKASRRLDTGSPSSSSTTTINAAVSAVQSRAKQASSAPALSEPSNDQEAGGGEESRDEEDEEYDRAMSMLTFVHTEILFIKSLLFDRNLASSLVAKDPFLLQIISDFISEYQQ